MTHIFVYGLRGLALLLFSGGGGFQGQLILESDLTAFEAQNNLPKQGIRTYGGQVYWHRLTESSLDVQYIIATTRRRWTTTTITRLTWSSGPLGYRRLGSRPRLERELRRRDQRRHRGPHQVAYAQGLNAPIREAAFSGIPL